MTQTINAVAPARGNVSVRDKMFARRVWMICVFFLCTTTACDQFDVLSFGQKRVAGQFNPSATNQSMSVIATNPLPLSDAVRLGVLKSNGVALAEIARAKSATAIQVSQAAYWPEIFVGISPTTTSGSIAAATAGVRYTLFDFGARAAQLNASKANQKGAENDVIAATNESVSLVLEKYIDFSVNTAIAIAARQYSDQSAELGTSIEARVKSGASSPADLNEIKVGALRAEAAVLKADADSANSRVELMSVTGVAPQSVQSAQSVQSLLSIDARDKQTAPDFSGFPRIRALDQTVLAAESNLQAVKAGRIPKFNLEASAGFDIGNGNAATTNGMRFGPSISNVFGLGGANAAKVSAAILDVNTARANRDEEMRRLNEQYLLSQNDIARTVNTAAKRQAIYDETAKMLDIFLAEYQGGSRALSEVVSVQDRLFQARVDALNASRDLLIANMRFLIATNKLSERVYRTPTIN